MSLDDCRIYEHFLKNKCLELSKDILKKNSKDFNTFDFKKVDDKPDIIEFIKTSKKQDISYDYVSYR